MTHDTVSVFPLCAGLEGTPPPSPLPPFPPSPPPAHTPHRPPRQPEKKNKMTPGPRQRAPIPVNTRPFSLAFRWPNYLVPSVLFTRHIPKPAFLQRPPEAPSAQQQHSSNVGDDGDNDASSSSSSYNSAITSPHTDTTASPSSSSSSSPSLSSSTHHVSPSLLSLSGSADPSASTSSSSDTSPTSQPTPSSGQNYLYGSTSILKCRRCQSDICFSETVISKGFNGRYGRAYLCNPIPTNTHTIAKATTRQLVTGTHLVADISCSVCLAPLGWKYISASDPYQQYKVGKYILETKSVTRVAHWQGHQARPQPPSITTSSSTKNLTTPPDPDGAGLTSWDFDIDTGKRELAQAEEWGDVNSEDDEELEDMFLGKWTPKLAAKRRKAWENEARRRGSDAAQQVGVGGS